MADELVELRESLLRRLRVDLRFDQGDEAFEAHQRLTSRFHRAAKLNTAEKQGDRKAWCRYFGEFLPDRSEHAELLFERWRCTLVKDEMPGAGVVITHGQPDTHWLSTNLGLCINLESMWDDFEASVGRFVESLRDNDQLRERTLDRFRARRWTVERVTATVMVHPPLVPNRVRGSYGELTSFPASASGTATAIVPATNEPPSLESNVA